MRFRSSEHAYQYLKMRFIDAEYAMRKVANAPTALAAKKAAGKTAYGKSEQMKWGSQAAAKRAYTARLSKSGFNGAQAMARVLALKYTGRNEWLGDALVATGNAFLGEETSRGKLGLWDIGGANLLGNLLMIQRARLVRERQQPSQPSRVHAIRLQRRRRPFPSAQLGRRRLSSIPFVFLLAKMMMFA